MTSCAYRHLSDSAGLMAAGRYNHIRHSRFCGTKVAGRLKKREISSRELTSMLFDHIDAVNPAVNAVVELRRREPLVSPAVTTVALCMVFPSPSRTHSTSPAFTPPGETPRSRITSQTGTPPSSFTAP